MKKYKLLKTLFISTPLLVTPLIAASCDTKKSNTVATDQQIKDAIFNFAKEHGINKNDIDSNSMSYLAAPEKNYLEAIIFSFKMKNNTADSYFLNTYGGIMIYHTDTKKFTLARMK